MGGWKIGRLEDWKIGRVEGWKDGRLWKTNVFLSIPGIAATYENPGNSLKQE